MEFGGEQKVTFPRGDLCINYVKNNKQHIINIALGPNPYLTLII